MTRALVTQLVEALDELHGNCSGYFSEGNYDMQLAAKALTTAREYLATEPSSERAELIVDLRELIDLHAFAKDVVDRAAHLLEADAQQANKPTGWDNGLSQDYCAEFGQWLASRPGARQQIKEMFDEPEDLYLHPPQPQATTPSIRQHCRECANWAKAVADTKEWAEGVKIGREIIKKLAAAQGEKP